jgi:hypothetical protein
LKFTPFLEVGVAISGFGLLFLFGGIILFFDTSLLALGNILFLIGLLFVLGLESTKRLFFRRDRLRGSLFFFLGALLVLIKWAKLGILVEFIGFINLFGDFFPYLINFARQLPVLGPILNLPVVSHVIH